MKGHSGINTFYVTFLSHTRPNGLSQSCIFLPPPFYVHTIITFLWDYKRRIWCINNYWGDWGLWRDHVREDIWNTKGKEWTDITGA